MAFPPAQPWAQPSPQPGVGGRGDAGGLAAALMACLKALSAPWPSNYFGMEEDERRAQRSSLQPRSPHRGQTHPQISRADAGRRRQRRGFRIRRQARKGDVSPAWPPMRATIHSQQCAYVFGTISRPGRGGLEPFQVFSAAAAARLAATQGTEEARRGSARLGPSWLAGPALIPPLGPRQPRQRTKQPLPSAGFHFALVLSRPPFLPIVRPAQKAGRAAPADSYAVPASPRGANTNFIAGRARGAAGPAKHFSRRRHSRESCLFQNHISALSNR